MTDFFCESSTMVFLEDLALWLRRPQKSLIVLVTKRPAELLAWQRRHFPDGLPRHVFCFLTVCNQEEADEKIPIMRQVVGRRGIHAEPLLDRLDLAYACFDGAESFGRMEGFEFIAAGAESGPGARPVDMDWLRSIRDQCAAAGVPFFLKRPGELDGVTHNPRIEMP
jgi:protein gp37